MQTTDIVRYSDVSSAIAEIGNLLLQYLSWKIMYTDWRCLDHKAWNQIVKEECWRINDPSFDIHTAHEIMESQDNKCKICTSNFTLDRPPSISKRVKTYNFLGFVSKHVQYVWKCPSCADFDSRTLEEKITLMLQQEDEKKMVECKIAIRDDSCLQDID